MDDRMSDGNRNNLNDYLDNRFSICSTRKYLSRPFRRARMKRSKFLNGVSQIWIHTERESKNMDLDFQIQISISVRHVIFDAYTIYGTMSVCNCYFRTVNWLDAIQMRSKFCNIAMHRSKSRWKVTRVWTKEAKRTAFALHSRYQRM